MPHSYAQTAERICPHCQRPFSAKLWLIVDISERPDLFERIRTGNLHNFTCPHCDDTSALDAPMLLYTAASVPTTRLPLLYSPANETNNEQNQTYAYQLLDLLRTSLGTEWRDEWLVNGLPVVMRNQLPAFLGDITDTQQHSSSRFEIPDEVRPLIAELGRLTGIPDMPRRSEVCQRVLQLVAHDTNPRLWGVLQVELGNSLAQSPIGDQSENLEHAIIAYQQALTVMTQQVMPIEWAQTMHNLGLAYYCRNDRDRIQNLEKAISAFQNALSVRTRDTMPIKWALTMSNLALAYYYRIRGDRAENIEMAISAYTHALTVISQETMSDDWATTMNNLALAYSDRIHGDKAENIEAAIEGYQKALRVRTQDAKPVEWAQTMSNLGTAYRKHIHGDRAENVEKAIAAYQQAHTILTRDTRPVDWATTMDYLAVAYANRTRGDRAENIEFAINACQQALTVRTEDTSPVEWAATIGNLANAYLERIQGDRAENIEKAIAACQQSLTVRTQESMPHDWAQSIMNLASAYLERIRGDRAENIEKAIAAYQQSLTVRTQESMPHDWAQTMNNLAIAYMNRIRGDRAQNIEEAIIACEQALTVRTKNDLPLEWAETMSNLADAYSDRIHGDKAENIEAAIKGYQRTLTVMHKDAMPVDWAKTINNLAKTYLGRISGDRAQNIEEAITHFRQALTIMTHEAMPIEWATEMMNLANAYQDRICGDKANNIEAAIEAYQQALTIRPREAMPLDWAQTMMNLGSAYQKRIRNDRTQNIEEAIVAYWQALTIMTQEAMPIEWATAMMNLATAYCERIRGDRAQNIEEAIAACRQALTIMTQEAMPIEWATAMMNLATAYQDRVCGDKANNIEAAIEAYQQALTIMTQEAMPLDWAQTMTNLAVAYADRIHGQRGQNLEEAITAYRKVLTVITQEATPLQWVNTMVNLANAYANRVLGDQIQNIEKAITTFQKALTIVTQDTMPRDHLLIQCNLGRLAFDNQQWRVAATAFQGALQAGSQLYAIAATPEARTSELREVRGLSVAYAYTLAQLNTDGGTALTEAVVTLDRNQARWLNESLALYSAKPATIPDALWQRFTETAAQIQELKTEANLPDKTAGKRDFVTLSDLLVEARASLKQIVEKVRECAPEFMPTPSFDDIQAAFAATSDVQAEVAVYLITTTQGGLALIIHYDRVTPVWLNRLTDEMSQNLLRDWLEAYDAFRHEFEPAASRVWFDCLNSTTQRLWDLAVGPIAAKLDELGLTTRYTSRPPVVTLIPTGLLLLFPLHAAWTDDSTTPTGRRYFLDDYAVHYAPSATALHYCRERVSDVSVDHLLALDEPKPIMRGGPLPNSSREVKAIASLFPGSTVLQHDQASRGTTCSALTAAQVAHFSCHGTHNWQNPLDSGLLLANDELLTMRDFLELHLPGARLVTLSACETGMIGGPLPDEVIMLPSALMQAGYAGVVASLWSVADVSTAMLMVRFYQFWREEGLAPVYALRAAQRWVRDTTNQEKADYFFQFVQNPTGQIPATIAAEFYRNILFSDAMRNDGPDGRSFAHPFWWAAFYLTGV